MDHNQKPIRPLPSPSVEHPWSGARIPKTGQAATFWKTFPPIPVPMDIDRPDVGNAPKPIPSTSLPTANVEMLPPPPSQLPAASVNASASVTATSKTGAAPRAPRAADYLRTLRQSQSKTEAFFPASQQPSSSCPTNKPRRSRQRRNAVAGPQPSAMDTAHTSQPSARNALTGTVPSVMDTAHTSPPSAASLPHLVFNTNNLLATRQTTRSWMGNRGPEDWILAREELHAEQVDVDRELPGEMDHSWYPSFVSPFLLEDIFNHTYSNRLFHRMICNHCTSISCHGTTWTTSKTILIYWLCTETPGLSRR